MANMRHETTGGNRKAQLRARAANNREFLRFISASRMMEINHAFQGAGAVNAVAVACGLHKNSCEGARELRAISFVQKLLKEGGLKDEHRTRLRNIHVQ